jgi:hypothetical protein
VLTQIIFPSHIQLPNHIPLILAGMSAAYALITLSQHPQVRSATPSANAQSASAGGSLFDIDAALRNMVLSSPGPKAAAPYFIIRHSMLRRLSSGRNDTSALGGDAGDFFLAGRRSNVSSSKVIGK